MPLNRLYPLLIVAILANVSARDSMGQERRASHAGLIATVVQDAAATPQDDAVNLRLNDSGSKDLPASITQPGGVLALAPAGIKALPALPTRGHGCNVCPDVRCKGPLYSGCSPRIYYGTHPYDDDPILPLYPRIDDAKTAHWYHAARRMVLRKKAVTEIVK